jgi:hypothetical protein
MSGRTGQERQQVQVLLLAWASRLEMGCTGTERCLRVKWQSVCNQALPAVRVAGAAPAVVKVVKVHAPHSSATGHSPEYLR